MKISQSTISAAATIGVFSWPETTETHWGARALWFTAMTLSFFSLISSHQSRLLGAIPPMSQMGTSPRDIEKAVRMITWMPCHASTKMIPTSTLPGSFQATLTLKNIAAIYIWQSAVMQMSWAWVMFLVGLTLHVIRILLPEQSPQGQKRVRPPSMGESTRRK